MSDSVAEAETTTPGYDRIAAIAEKVVKTDGFDWTKQDYGVTEDDVIGVAAQGISSMVLEGANVVEIPLVMALGFFQIGYELALARVAEAEERGPEH